MKVNWIRLCIVVVLVACGQEKKERTPRKEISGDVVLSQGLLVPADSIEPPEVVPVLPPERLNITTGPTVSPGNNIRIAGTPRVTVAGKPYIARPGEAIFEKPIVTKADGKIKPAIQPEPVNGGDPRFRDNASYNFQYLDVEQGLPKSYIHNVYQDKAGDLWISSSSALSRYDGEMFTTFTAKEGLVDETTKAVIEDSKGNMWFATRNGAVKYDGSCFTHYNDTTGLPGNAVRDVMEDKQGRIWFATNKGLCYLENGQFTSFTTKQGLTSDDVTSLLCDSRGNTWCGTESGLSRFDGKEFNSWTATEGFPSPRILSMEADRDGNIWMAGSGLYKFDGKEFTQYTPDEGLLNNDTRDVMFDRQGNIWIGCYGAGVDKFDGKNFTGFTEQDGLTLNTIWCVYEDNAGNIWMGTDGGGLCKYTGNSFRHFTGKDGMDKTIMTIHDDKDGTVWLGTYAFGLWKYDGKGFAPMIEKDANSLSTVRSMMEAPNGAMWFGVEGGGFVVHEGDDWKRFHLHPGARDFTVSVIYPDTDGDVWIGTFEDGIRKFDGKNFTSYTKKQGLCGNSVNAILRDKKGALWIGTTKGLNKIEGDKVYRFTEKEGLTKKNIKELALDRNGNLWIGTIGGGVNMYDGKNMTHFTTSNGMSDDFIRSLVEDRPENLPKDMTGIWASTDNGIDHILTGNKKFSDTDTSLKETRIVVYKKPDGLKGEDFTSKSGFQDRHGRIWWGSVKSLVMLDAKKVKNTNEIPVVKLSHISLEQNFVDFRALRDSIANGKKWLAGEKQDADLSSISFTGVKAFENYPENLELPYNIHNITFNYSATDWTAPHKIRYQFMLEGEDKDWNPVTTEMKAVYTNLNSGDYTFKVKAKGFSDIWSESMEYHFVIHPPWWKTVWAWLAYIIAFILLSLLLLKWRTRALIERQKELEQEVQLHTFQLRKEKEKVEEKNEIIERKQQEILDSINYSKRLQRSRMASEKYIDNTLRRLMKK